ncbi:MAG: DUF6807 family protein [Luteolibacter sp.]|jgi:hypothetical protein
MKPAIIALTLATIAIAQPLWKADGNRSLEFADADATHVRFVLDAAPRDPHFEILATPDGRNTVWVGPPDHVWHYGVWFSWKYINGVNFWETNPQTGKQQGLNRIEGATIEAKYDGDTATVRYRELAFPDPDGPAVLEDAVEIEIRRPSDTTGPHVIWRVTTTALADVTLDRTPIAGEPNGRDWGGYAGFSWRGAKGFKDVRFIDSESRKEMDIHGQSARWINIVGLLNDKPAGILIINQAGNPGEIPPWYITHQPRHPFWFANPARLLPNAIPMKQGESFEHAYQIIVHSGSLDPGEIDRSIEKFTPR